MDITVIEFINSIINFCKCALEIPVKLYTFGLDTCPWVIPYLDAIKINYGIDILNIIPNFQNVIDELKNISIIL